MEYTVGSLADLITGSESANKTKVVVKKFVPVKISQTTEKNSSGVEKQKKNAKSVKSNDTTSFIEKQVKKSTELQENQSEPLKRKEKRKPDTENEQNNWTVTNSNDSPAKKSRNDEHAERRIKKKEKQQSKVEEDPILKARTIFVNNIPITATKKQIRQFFSTYGGIESVRIRGVAVANPKTPKKVAFIRKEFHPERKTFHAYVRFSTRDEALKALEANGSWLMNHHLIVDMSDNKQQPDESKAIYVGNLSFNAEVDDLWKIFEPCGAIYNIRIVRDPRTGMGKGFAYVNFRKSDSVQLALSMENVELNNRELRISVCNIKAAHKNKKTNSFKKIKQAGKPKIKKPRANKIGDDNEDKKTIIQSAQFQGSKFLEKKKKKQDPKDKKKMIKLVAPRIKAQPDKQ